MVQRGHTYRAARPRCIPADMGWNNQAPYRMRFNGGFGFGENVITFPNIPSDPAVFTPDQIKFDWSGAFSFLGESFDWIFTQLQRTSVAGVLFQLAIEDSTGATCTCVWTWTLGSYTWGEVYFLNDPLPKEQTATGDFRLNSIFGSAVPITYDEEP